MSLISFLHSALQLFMQLAVFISLITWTTNKYTTVYDDDIGLIKFSKIFPQGYQCDVWVSDPFIKGLFLLTRIEHEDPDEGDLYDPCVEEMYKVDGNDTHVQFRYRYILSQLIPGHEIWFWFNVNLDDTRLKNIMTKKRKLIVTSNGTFVIGNEAIDYLPGYHRV